MLLPILDSYEVVHPDRNSMEPDVRDALNDVVMSYNTLQQQFPANMVAGMAGSRPGEYFKVEIEEAREAPKVSFE